MGLEGDIEVCYGEHYSLLINLSKSRLYIDWFKILDNKNIESVAEFLDESGIFIPSPDKILFIIFTIPIF